MKHFILTWLCALIIAVYPLIVWPQAAAFGLVIAWLVLVGLGTLLRDFRLFAAAGAAGVIGYGILALGLSVLDDFGALAMGLVFFVMLESSYLACLTARAEKSSYSNVKYEVEGQAEDWKRWYFALGKRTAILAGIGVVLVLVLHAASDTLLPEEWFFPLLLVAAASLGIVLYRAAAKRF